MPIAGRTIPHSPEAEQALLGACLIDKEAVNAALEYIRAEDFYRDENRLIFACLQKLALENQPCDLVTITDALTAAGDLERIGGVNYLVNLLDTVPSTVSAPYYAQIIAEKATVRHLITVGETIAAEGLSGTIEAADLLEKAESSIFAVAERNAHQGFYPIGTVALDVMELISKMKSNNGVTGIPTFRDMDKLLSGLQKSDLIILAARPGMGKTSMALNIAQKAAVEHKKTVAIFSLEMPKEQLVTRMLCSAAEVDQSFVRSGRVNKDDLKRLSRQLGTFEKAQIFLDDTPGITVIEMRSKLRKLKREHKELDLVVIDYLQLMSGSSRAENRQQEISGISRALKALAKELDVPILALSQLSRLVERSSEPPNLSHLRESGALEQDADVVIFIHRPKDEEEDSQNTVKVIIAKHRNGSTGEVEMAFIPSQTRFADLAQAWMGQNQAPPPPSAQSTPPLPNENEAPPEMDFLEDAPPPEDAPPF